MRKMLTIAIPVYNRRAFLARALDSIYSQSSLDEIEVIVSDNCSTDGTEEFLNAYCAGRDIIRLKNSENLGADRNFLNCYQNASGKYVMLLGSDDVLLPGALDVIVGFLKEYPAVDWVFLNQALFHGEYPKSITGYFGEDFGTFITSSKEKFINYARIELTFMSSHIIRTDLVNMIDNQKKYIETSFIHTNLMFEAVHKSDAVFGVITKPCIAKDQTEHFSEEVINKRQFLVFGKRMHYCLCEVAVENGFPPKIMRRIYIRRLVSYWPRMILTMKAKHINNWQISFWENGYPYIKGFPVAWLTIMPAVFTPTYLCVFLYRVVRPVFKKLKASRGRRGG